MNHEKDPDPVKQTDREIDKLSKSPLWVFGWGLFLTSLTFISGVVLDLNEQNAYIAKYNSLAHTYELDNRKPEMVKKTLALVMDGTLKAETHFADNVERQSDLASIREDVINEGLFLVTSARKAVNAELGVFSTLHFNDAGLNLFVEGFKADMEALDDLLATKESIYQKIKDKKFAEVRTELDKLKVPDYRKERQLNAFSHRVNAFDAESKLKKDEYDADLQLQSAHLRSFRYKFYLVLPMSMIVGAFAVMVIKKFKRIVV